MTFMPKPLFGDNGSGMHCHQSLWKDGDAALLRRARLRRPVGHRPLVHRRPAQARAVAAGVHQPDGELLPPPGARASRPRSTWSTPQRNRSACVRIPVTGTIPKAKRIEFRVPDPSCNPYLAFSAQLMAGLDGIKNKIEPPEPVDKDLYELPPEEHADIPQVPGSLARGARRARGRPRLPARGRRLHRGPDRDLDRLQARPTRSTRSGCARTRTSSSSTTTSRPYTWR